MQNRIKNFFTSDKVLRFNTILCLLVAVVSSILMLVFGFRMSHIGLSVMILFTAFCVLVVEKSYFSHDKNTMKGMMGFLLAVCLFSEILQLSRVFDESQYADLMSHGVAGMIYVVVQCLCLLLFAIIIVSHFVINSNHHSNWRAIFFNQCIIMIEAVAVVIEIVLSIVFHVAIEPIRAAYWSFNYLVAIFAMNTIVCIESKLDAYKVRREADGWKEE